MTDNLPALRLDAVERTFISGSETVHALRGVSFQVERGESVAVLGPSGSGKSTLLGLVAGLEHPNKGAVYVGDQRLADCSEDQLADLRARRIGVIFQQFRLLPDLTALENVMVPLELTGQPQARRTSRALVGRSGFWRRARSIVRLNYPAVSNSVWRLLVPWRFSPILSLLMNRRAHWMPQLVKKLQKRSSLLCVNIRCLYCWSPMMKRLAEKTDRIVRLRAGAVQAAETRYSRGGR